MNLSYMPAVLSSINEKVVSNYDNLSSIIIIIISIIIIMCRPPWEYAVFPCRPTFPQRTYDHLKPTIIDDSSPAQKINSSDNIRTRLYSIAASNAITERRPFQSTLHCKDIPLYSDTIQHSNSHQVLPYSNNYYWWSSTSHSFISTSHSFISNYQRSQL